MVGATGGLPLRGRGDELAAIGARLDEIRSGVGSVIIVEGRAGLGKTRLLDACELFPLFPFEIADDPS